MLNHKICLVSGSTAGIGFETAKAMACQGATVVLSGRNRYRCDQSLQMIRKASGHERVYSLLGDMSLQTDIRQMAQQYLKRFDHLDILINNVGGFFGERKLTSEGFENTWALNHLAYFVLTQELLPALKNAPSARIINLASEAHKSAQWNWENLQGEIKYSGFSAYARSKLANLMFTYALSRRLNQNNITVNAAHPGNVGTAIWDIGPDWSRPITRILRKGLRSPKAGARTSVYLASSPELGAQSGGYYSDCQLIQPSKLALNQSLQEELWQLSLEQVGLN